MTRPSITTDSAGRAVVIVEDLLGAAVREGSRAVSYARLGISLLVVISWPLMQGPALLALVPRVVAVFVAGVFGVVFSIVALRLTRERAPTLLQRNMAILVDALIVNGFLATFVFWPGPNQVSLLSVHGTAIVYLAIVSTGVRLSKPSAIFGIVTNSVLFYTLLIIDTVRVDDPELMGVMEFVTVTAFIVCAAVLALTLASRARRLVLQGATEALVAARARSMLGAYVSTAVAEQALESDDVTIGGKRQHVAVLFSDLRGFTSYSESLAPEELVEQLNAYLEVMVSIIQRRGGVIDKYMGDGIMAVFGAPKSSDDDAVNAILAAAEMELGLQRHNKDRARKGLTPFCQGIGVHYGAVVAGNVGTPSRAAYTVIGDTVNLASRLEAATKDVGVSLLLSESVKIAAEASKDAPAFRPVSTIKVRGREQEIEVFTIA